MFSDAIEQLDEYKSQIESAIEVIHGLDDTRPRFSISIDVSDDNLDN